MVAGDGVYNQGGTVIFGSETNRVALTNAVTLLSVDGAVSATIMGGTAMRGAYVGSNAVLMGFTITNGSGRSGGDLVNEQSGGGVWCQGGGVVSNCLVTGNNANSGAGRGGGVYGGTIYNSTLKLNSSQYGGGASAATLINCLIASNALSAGGYGGGVYQVTASNCIITTNRAYYNGGGAYQSTLYNCTVSLNISTMGGGGADQSLLYNCTVVTNVGYGGGTSASTNYNCMFAGNTGTYGGGTSGGISYGCVLSGNIGVYQAGGAYLGTLNNCVLYGNKATNTISFYGMGGGAYQSILNNCTVVSNSAVNAGGGVYGGTGSVNNSIVYYNSCTNGSNWSGAKFNYSCTAPSPERSGFLHQCTRICKSCRRRFSRANELADDQCGQEFFCDQRHRFGRQPADCGRDGGHGRLRISRVELRSADSDSVVEAIRVAAGWFGGLSGFRWRWDEQLAGMDCGH